MIHRFGDGARQVLALHCAQGTGGMFARLALPGTTVCAPDLLGHGDLPLWDGKGDFHALCTREAIALAEAAGPVDLIGHSLGGWIAALIAALAKIEVRKLVLACPAGLRVQGINTTDLFTIPAEQLLSYLVSDPKTLKKMSEVVPTNEMRVGRYREMTSLARIIWEKGYDPKLDRVLTHIRADTLILWGEQDRILPVELAKHWAKDIPQATVKTFQGAGHLLLAENEASLKAASDFVSA